MDKIIAILIAILALILMIFGIFLVVFYGNSVTGGAVLSEHSYTKAICNSSNYCEDYEVVCSAGELQKLSPTGYSVQLSGSWNDTRKNKNFDGLC